MGSWLQLTAVVHGDHGEAGHGNGGYGRDVPPHGRQKHRERKGLRSNMAFKKTLLWTSLDFHHLSK